MLLVFSHDKYYRSVSYFHSNLRITLTWISDGYHEVIKRYVCNWVTMKVVFGSIEKYVIVLVILRL
jgi:hypothetical protein